MLKNSIRQKTFRKIKKLEFCEMCGRKDVRLVRHHTDYRKPFEVMILCDKCHYEWHQKNKAIEAKNYRKEKIVKKPFIVKHFSIKSLKVKVREDSYEKYTKILKVKGKTIQQDLEEYINQTIK